MPSSKEPEHDRRRFPRLKTPIYYRSTSSFGMSRKASNISLGGIRIFSNLPLQEGKSLEVELLLPTGNSVKTIARVVWIKALPSGSEADYDIGLEFIDYPEDFIHELESLLKAQDE